MELVKGPRAAKSLAQQAVRYHGKAPRSNSRPIMRWEPEDQQLNTSRVGPKRHHETLLNLTAQDPPQPLEHSQPPCCA